MPAAGRSPTTAGRVDTISIFAPAKINLFLAITGRREDGFHDLVSVVAPLEFGDTLRAERADATTLVCNDPEVPVDESNLVLRAARAFARATGWTGSVRFTLEKRIPPGAGLGGGSSDAVATLRALNALAGPGCALEGSALASLAAELGSDCPLFLAGSPVVMRGRGERLEKLPPAAAIRLSRRRVLLFKPGFGVPTPWAYAQMAARAPQWYLPGPEAEARLATWLEAPSLPVETLCFNNMEKPVFAKYVTLPVLQDQLRRELGAEMHLSGSGSACFVLLADEGEVSPLKALVRAAWGDGAFVAETRIP